MLGNSWFKKENPLLGLTGMAGGAAPLGGGGTPGIYKASGGQVEMQWESPTGGMSIHIFTAPGQTFACPPTFNETCHFVIIGDFSFYICINSDLYLQEVYSQKY